MKSRPTERPNGYASGFMHACKKLGSTLLLATFLYASCVCLCIFYIYFCFHKYENGSIDISQFTMARSNIFL